MVNRSDPSAPKDTWHAAWCWTALRLPRPWNTVVYFRRVVNLPEKPSVAPVRISADSRYSLWVNGRWAHFGPARCTPATQAYDTIDLADLLHAGSNCIAAIVEQFGVPTSQSVYRDAAGFILDGFVQTSAGIIDLHTPGDLDQSKPPASDEAWLCREAQSFRKHVARRGDGLGFQEHFDADGDPADWMLPEFAATPAGGWKPPVVVAPTGGYPWTSLCPRGVPLLVGSTQPFALVVAQFTGPNARGYKVAEDVLAPYAQETRRRVKLGLDNADALLRDDDQPATLSPPAEGNFHMVVLDLGRVAAGNLIVNISQAAGDEFIDVIYTSELDRGLLPLTHGGLADRYRCRPGPQAWETFIPRGFRYAALIFRNVEQPLKLRNVAVRTLHAAIAQVGAFECSDPVLNSVYQAAANTLNACMLDAYVDAPDRAQAQRWHEARAQFAAGAWAFGDVSLLERGILQMAQSQAPDGSLHGAPPADDPHGRCIDSMLAWIGSLWDYHAYTGRTELLSHCRPMLARLLEFLAARQSPEGWLGGFSGFELHLDSALIRKSDVSGALNLLYLLALQDAARIYEALGEPEEAQRVQSQSQSLAHLIREHLWDEKQKHWRDGFDPGTGKPVETASLHVAALAVLAGLMPQVDPVPGREMLYRPMATRRGKIAVPSPAFASYVLDALAQAGFLNEAIELIRTRWGALLNNGVTTLPEHWDGTPGSRCCGAAPAPLRILAKHVLGVRQNGIGRSRIRIAPWVGSLDFARGTVPSPLGPIRVEWEKVAEDQLAVRVDLPEGMTAEFVTPLSHTRDLNPGTSEFHT